jgi:hypothetical protein
MVELGGEVTSMFEAISPVPAGFAGTNSEAGEVPRMGSVGFGNAIRQTVLPPLLSTAPLVFTMASVLIAFYVALVSHSDSVTADPGAILVLIPILTWLLLALGATGLGLTRADRVNASSYRMLQADLEQLRVCFHSAEKCLAGESSAGAGAHCEVKRLALQQLRSQIETIQRELEREGPQWVAGHGYVALCRQVNRAKEAWLQLMPWQVAVAECDRARRCLSGSLLDEVSAGDLTKALSEAAAALRPAGPAANAEPALAPTAAGLTPDEARTKLAQVWQTIHDYRDDRWQGLINCRNQLLFTMSLSGVVLYGMIGFALLALKHSPPNEDEWWKVLGAAAVFIVGASVGLFNRLYAQNQLDTAGDDYGLTTARLILSPQLSGLAAVLGVGLAQVVSGTTISGGPADMHWNDVFNLEKSQPLLLAAILGLTPGILFNQIKGREQALNELKSTQPSAKAS